MRERFAPSPTGLLHLGHAFSALTAWDCAQQSGAEFLLRIEDIDTQRSQPKFEVAIVDDLHWLGLDWQEAPVRQSERLDVYNSYLNTLIKNNICYPCRCSRHDIKEALRAPQESSADRGAQKSIYPGTCQQRYMSERTVGDAVRLNMKSAIDRLGGPRKIEKLGYWEGAGPRKWVPLRANNLLYHFGDVVLARKDIGTSYHLAVVVDDFDQQISHVTRGEDMSSSTAIHVLLQALLEFSTPIYRHHRLIRDENGQRLAKRDDARAIAKFRAQGVSPKGIRDLVGL
ncbi:MAG: tRNA glutamyl-Q(34) synthetase GluQRS [Alphaproteobacteria bacterium]|nr:tRNA glutamyl-Q(34) synthetase GluQRS [Alphaproteobacteria bacterium]